MNFNVIKRVLVISLVSALLSCLMLGYIVRQNERVVVTRFGKPVKVVLNPGLYGKLPWPIEAVNRIDARLNFFEVRLSESLTKDRRNIIIPVFIAWKVEEPLKFLEAIGSPENAKSKLDSLVSSAKNTVFGTCDFKQLVSSAGQADVKLPEIEAKIMAIVVPQARNFGIVIQQVGIERIMLPEANTTFVFDRMRAERSQFAESYLAEGRKQADAIRAKTTADQTVILAEAQKQAEIKRGEGEAEAAHIYSEAHGRNPELYVFLRQIDTLKKTINQNTTLVLDANQPPFDLLKKGINQAPSSLNNEPKKN